MTDTTTQPDPRSGKRKPWWARMARTTVGLMILAAVFYMVPVAGVFEVLRSAEPLEVLGAAVTAFVMQWVVSDRLRRLCDAHGLGWSTWEVFQINLATRFYGFLPGGNLTGIIIRFYKLTGDKKHYLGTAVALFYDRIAATVSLCGVGAAFWLLERPHDSWQALVAILAAMLVMIAALIVLFDRSPGPVTAWLRRAGSRLAGLKLHTLRQAVRESRTLSRRHVVFVYATSVAAHLLGVVGWYLLCRSLSIDVSMTTVGWVRSGMILATMIPVSAFGLGLREGAAVLLFSGYGVGSERSVAFSLLVFAVFFLSIGLAGGLVEANRLLRRRT